MVKIGLDSKNAKRRSIFLYPFVGLIKRIEVDAPRCERDLSAGFGGLIFRSDEAKIDMCGSFGFC
jgi:hypothetical protein